MQRSSSKDLEPTGKTPGRENCHESETTVPQAVVSRRQCPGTSSRRIMYLAVVYIRAGHVSKIHARESVTRRTRVDEYMGDYNQSEMVGCFFLQVETARCRE